MAKRAAAKTSEREVKRQGAVLEVARSLLQEGRDEKVLSLISRIRCTAPV